MPTTDNPIESAQSLGSALLRALGLNPNRTCSIVITCEAGEIPMATVKFVIPKGFGEAAASMLQAYEIVPVHSETLPSLDTSVCLGSVIHMTHRLVDLPESDQT